MITLGIKKVYAELEIVSITNTNGDIQLRVTSFRSFQRINPLLVVINDQLESETIEVFNI